MKSCSWLWVVVWGLLAAPACQSDPPVGIGDAAPLIADYEEALGQLDEVVAALDVGSAPPEKLLRVPQEDTIPAAVLGDLNRIGERMARVTFSVMSGSSDPQAVTVALAAATARVRRDLADAAGATIEGRRAVLPPPDPIVKGDLWVDLAGLIYVALLANPQARSALAPNLSPAAIPEVTPELAEELNLPVGTRKEWQDALFDEGGRLVLPTSEEGARYNLLREWALAVNEGLAAQATGLFDIALDAR